MSIFPKHAFGLDISDTSIEALEIIKRFGKLTISAYNRTELEPGIVSNGRILDKLKLVIAIQELYETARPRRFKTKNVILSVPESKTFIHIFRLPAVISSENLGESIQYEAEEIIPLSYNQIYHDFQPITKKDKHQEVLYVAGFKDVIDDFREVVARAGLNPIIFETESISLARALVRDDLFEGVLIADIGARTTILTIYDHQGIRYSDNIEIAGNKFSEKIAHSLKISLDKAEKMKKEVGLGQIVEDNGVFSSLEPLAQEIIQAIKKAVTHYQKRTGFVITRVVLCGGTSLMPGLAAFLNKQLGIRVETGKPFEKLQYNRKVFSESQAVLFSTVIGLALRGVDTKQFSTSINLLHHEKERRKFKVSKEPRKPAKKEPRPGGRFTNKRLLILLAVFIFLLLVFASVFFLSQGRDEPLINFQSTDYPTQPTNYQTANVPLSLEAELIIYTRDTGNLPEGALTGQLLEKVITKTKEFTTTGTKSVDQVATGTVKIINNYSADQRLITTTRFLTPEGILFRLKEGTSVPARGSVEAEIYADQPGQQGEVEPTRLSIPGLSASMQEYVYGELNEPTTGGSREVTYVSETDLENARSAIDEELDIADIPDFSQDLKEGEIIFPEFLSTASPSYNFSKEAGEEAETLSLSVEVTVTVLVFFENDIIEQLNELLVAKISADQEVADYQLSDIQYTLEDLDQETGVVTIKSASQASLAS